MIYDEKATNWFVGRCDDCHRPARVTRTNMVLDKIHVPCRECGQEIPLSRLYAAKEDTSCDGQCMSASGPNCSCGCGGKNHGKSWAYEEVEISADALDAYRARKQREAEDRERKEAKKAAAKEAKFQRWAAEAEVLWIMEQYDKRLQRDPQYRPSGFLEDMMRDLGFRRILSDRQLEVVRRIAGEELVDWESNVSEPVESAEPPAVPVGDAVAMEGCIVKVISRPGYRYNTTETRMLLEGNPGWKVWMNVPKALSGTPLTGKQVAVTADVTAGREAGVGNGKRPRHAAFI